MQQPEGDRTSKHNGGPSQGPTWVVAPPTILQKLRYPLVFTSHKLIKAPFCTWTQNRDWPYVFLESSILSRFPQKKNLSSLAVPALLIPWLDGCTVGGGGWPRPEGAASCRVMADGRVEQRPAEVPGLLGSWPWRSA
jgi:hypothetical protein